MMKSLTTAWEKAKTKQRTIVLDPPAAIVYSGATLDNNTCAITTKKSIALYDNTLKIIYDYE